jgi:hypothetical protein
MKRSLKRYKQLLKNGFDNAGAIESPSDSLTPQQQVFPYAGMPVITCNYFLISIAVS